MVRNPMTIILLVVLFVLGSLIPSSSLDMGQVLESHDPRGDGGSSSSPAIQPSQAPTTSPAPGISPSAQGVIDLIDEITKIIEEITKILGEKTAENVANDSKDKNGKEDNGDKGAGGGTYTIQPGDTLWGIAQSFLGDGNRYWDLVEANKGKYPSIAKNPNLIFPGWQLTIPGGAGQQNPGGSSQNNPTPGTSNPTPSAAPTPTTAPNVPAPASGAKGGKALLGWLQQAGLSGDNLRTAWAVGMAESGGNPRAFNGNSNTGDKSYGLFQINMIGRLGPARLNQYGLKSNEDLFDPAVNVRVMIRMSGNCTNWSPWSAYKSGSYRKFLSQFPPR